jgi:hypothetical protein
MLKAFTAGTATAATGKTIAVTISKDGGAFANPSAGATNATELASGWYYVDLSTTDTNTLADLIVRGTEGTIDPTERLFAVVAATNGGLTALPATAVTVNASLPTLSAFPTNFPATVISAGGLVDTNLVTIDGTGVDTGLAQIGVNLVNVDGVGVNPALAQLGVNVVTVATGAITAAAIADAAIDTATFATGATMPRVTLVDTTTTMTNLPAPMTTGVLQTGGSTTNFTLAAGETLNFLGCTIKFTSGAAAGNFAVIQLYSITTKTGTMSPSLPLATADGDGYTIYPIGTAMVGGFNGSRLTTTGGTNVTTFFNGGTWAAGTVPTVASVTAIAGTTQTLDALQTALNSAHGAGSWATATGFSTLTEANVRTAVGLASANLDTQLADLPTVAEFEARTIVAANYATAASISALNNLSAAQVTAAVPTAAQNAAGLLDLAAGVETGLTVRQGFRLIVAASAGKLSGAATTTVSIRNTGDDKNRVVAQVDSSGNRTSVTYDLT